MYIGFSRAVFTPDARIASGLLLAFVALLPAEPLYNLPAIALAILGVLGLVSGSLRLGAPENRFLWLAFLCIWLPMVASLPDATNFLESARKTASVCVYFLAGIYAVDAYRRFAELDWIMWGVGAICGFWVLDALWQFWTGANWFGVSYEDGSRLPGMFYTGRIGYILASFAPLLFEAVRRLSRRWRWSPALFVPVFVVIFLSGSRTAWGALAIATAGYLLFWARWLDRSLRIRGRSKSRGIAAVLGPLVLIAAVGAFAWSGGADRIWKVVEPRVETLSGLWSGDREQFERAVTWRLSIWMTAGNMWSDNWLNGVGPRGFRYAYEEYNPEEDYYLLHDETRNAATGPHMQLLEIAAETGLIGILGYLVLAVGFVANLRGLPRETFVAIYPYALTLVVAVFPFAGHLGFYGVLGSGVIWWMIIVCASAFAVARRLEADT